MPSWVGDACMATPTLRALRQGFPQAEIVGIMQPVISDLLRDAWQDEAPWLDDFILFSKRRSRDASSRYGLIRALRRRRIQLAVLLPNSFWSAAVTRLAGIKQVVGYDRDARRWMLSDRLSVPRDGSKLKPIAAVDYYLGLANWLGCDIGNRNMQLSVSKAEEAWASQLWSEIRFSPTMPTVVINSSSATQPTRVWPADKVRELAVRIALEWNWQVLLHCGPGEREITNRIAAVVNHPLVASMGVRENLPIGLSKAVLRRAQVVVSTDSGPRHMAVALGRQVVALFGPTEPAWTTTYNRRETAIQAPPSNEPVGRQHRMQRCTSQIRVDTVVEAIRAAVRRDAQAA